MNQADIDNYIDQVTASMRNTHRCVAEVPAVRLITLLAAKLEEEFSVDLAHEIAWSLPINIASELVESPRIHGFVDVFCGAICEMYSIIQGCVSADVAERIIVQQAKTMSIDFSVV